MSNIKPIEKYNKDVDTVFIDDCSIEYVQCGDTTDGPFNKQRLEIKAVNNGVARFLKIITNENGWSFSDIDELIDLINDFKKRAEL